MKYNLDSYNDKGEGIYDAKEKMMIDYGIDLSTLSIDVASILTDFIQHGASYSIMNHIKKEQEKIADQKESIDETNNLES